MNVVPMSASDTGIGEALTPEKEHPDTSLPPASKADNNSTSHWFRGVMIGM